MEVAENKGTIADVILCACLCVFVYVRACVCVCMYTTLQTRAQRGSRGRRRGGRAHGPARCTQTAGANVSVCVTAIVASVVWLQVLES